MIDRSDLIAIGAALVILVTGVVVIMQPGPRETAPPDACAGAAEYRKSFERCLVEPTGRCTFTVSDVLEYRAAGRTLKQCETVPAVSNL